MGGPGSGPKSKHNNGGYRNGKPKVYDDDLMLKMRLEEGKTLEEIGQFFGVSKQAIDLRLKKYEQYIKKHEIVKKHGITKEEGEFCDRVASGCNLPTAMLAIRQDLTPGSAKNVAMELRKREDIKATIRDLMEVKGIGLERRVERLRDHVEAKDAMVSLKALDMSFKLDGSLIAETRTEQTINVGILDLSAYAAKPVEIKDISNG